MLYLVRTVAHGGLQSSNSILTIEPKIVRMRVDIIEDWFVVREGSLRGDMQIWNVGGTV